MATYAYTFTSGDTVTPTKLNNARTVSDIVNADIKSDAAIAGTKIAPDFGSQNIMTTGAVRLNGATSGAFGSINNAVASPQLSLINNFNGNSSYCPFIVLAKQRGSGAVQNGDRLAAIVAQGHDGTQLANAAGVNFEADGAVSTGVVPGRITFSTQNTSGINAERMRITRNGDLLLGTTASINVASGSDDGFTVYGGQGASGVFQASNGGQPCAYLRRRTSNGTIIQFNRDTTSVGSISVTTTATAFNTSSDYRLKDNAQPMSGALSRLSQLNPVTFTWKSNGEQGEGFIAHELQAVVPEAVTGEKDAVDASGSPQYQGVDASKLVPMLVAAVQELSAKVNALEAQ